MTSSPRLGRFAHVEDASSDLEAEDVPGPRSSGLHLNNAHQSVIAQTVNNAQGVNFVSNATSTISDPPAQQSIFAKTVHIQGDVTYNSQAQTADSGGLTVTEWISKLSSSRFDDKHNEHTQTSRKGPGTGRWLLESSEFIDWVEGHSKKVLWCYGIPGAGKTVLASIIINHIQNGFKFKDSNAACIYVYFDYKSQKKQDLSNLLSNLLAQLVRQGDHITEEVKAIHRAFKSRAIYPSPDDILRMLKSQVKCFARVYIVVDALDECLNDSESNTMDDFLKALRQFPETVHTLYTSRHDSSIGSKVQADTVLEIVARPDDLRRYLETRVKTRAHLQKLIAQGRMKDEAFLDRTLDAIVARSKGMFLLAQLHVDFLADKYTLEDFEQGISNLPQDPDEVYRIALERISKQGEFKHKLAINVLTWLVFAIRPLTISELKHALAIRVDNKTFSEDRLLTEHTWTSACAGIVVIDPGTNVVRLAHYTAETYLRNNETTIFKDAQSIMAEICLVYLSLKEFSQIPSTPKEITIRQEKYPFYKYAADHWGDHCALGGRGSVYRLAWEFLSDGPKVMGTFQAMSHHRFQLEVDVTGLHVAAYFGLDKLAKRLLSRGFELNAKTGGGETALHWAVCYGHRQFLKVLIEQEADVNVADSKGRTALHKATFNEDVLAVEMLLALGRRIDLDLEDSQRWTALRWAAAHDQIAIIEILLKHGAHIDARDKDGWTALRWAAQQGHRKVVELLVQKGASVECSDGWTLLEWAAREGHDRFIRLMVEKRIDLNATKKEDDGWTALRWAIEYGHGMAAWILIQARANINKVDKKGWAPLHVAADKWAESKDKSLIWLLLENGADINARTKLGLSTLHIAATKGHSSVVWLLLEKGANARQVDNNNRTALHCAIIEGHQSISWVLIQKERRLIHATDDDRRTPLHVAASSGHLSITTLLLEHGAEINALDREGNTPLHCTVSMQHLHLVAHFAERGADLNIPNNKRWTPIHTAASSGNKKIMKALLQFGPDTTAKDGEGRTPWELAKAHGHKMRKF